MMESRDMLDEQVIPDDNSRQASSLDFVRHVLLWSERVNTVLDLGCGEGNSVDFFRKHVPHARWVGVDIADSSEVNKRTRNDAEFVAFDGVHIPFEDNTFDLIYCNQVFEHVRYPEMLLEEIERVLKPGGLFVGSTSQMEPFHSRSIGNYTPYGFDRLATDAGLQLIKVRPGIDAFALISVRFRGFGRLARICHWFDRESPLNRMISVYGRLAGKSHREINHLKLKFCGQYCFLIQKSEGLH